MENITIEQIKNIQWIGNAYDDRHNFDIVDKFVRDTNNSVKDRAEASRIASDKGMGCGRDEEFTDEEIIQMYFQ